MVRIYILRLLVPLILIACPSFGHATASATPLSLEAAEHMAVTTAPELQQLQANTSALQEQAIADGQLSDPKLIVGAANVPVNSLSFAQDDMTMVEVELQQSFAPGQSLAMKSKKTFALAEAERHKMQAQAAMLLLNVRETWLDLYYWNQAAIIISKNLTLYQSLLKATESQYISGKSSQSEVLQLQVELSRLNDQKAQAEQHIDVLRAQLGRWIGRDGALRPLSRSLPRWPKPLSAAKIQAKFSQHPLLKVDAANIEAAGYEVNFAKEQYKPGWMVAVGYGMRKGRMADGQPRSNFVGAQVTIDLPVFPGSRQDKRLHAGTYQLAATKLEKDIHYKDLLQQLTAQYAIWQSLAKRENVYRQHLYPEAKQNATAALLAYQSATVNLTTVLRAYSTELTISLEQTQIQVERAKARATLFYLEGVMQ